jgi:GT2 family glycosyltransferase
MREQNSVDTSSSPVCQACSLIVPTITEREQQLYELLNYLLALTEKPGEVIIVTDGSTKPSWLDEMTVRYEREGMELKFRRAPEGLTSGAHRNLGIKTSSGKYILFLDDDTLPETDWLSKIKKSLVEGADIVGGPSRPFFIHRIEPPLWWDAAMLGPYVAVGNEYILSKEYALWTCNFAMRDVVAKKITFDETLGMRKHGPQIYGEDSSFVKRATRYGFKVVFNPDAIVQHRLDNTRLTLKYLKMRALREGFSLKIAGHYSTRMMLNEIMIRLLRGLRLALIRKGRITSLPVYLYLLLYEIIGWLVVHTLTLHIETEPQQKIRKVSLCVTLRESDAESSEPNKSRWTIASDSKHI